MLLPLLARSDADGVSKSSNSNGIDDFHVVASSVRLERLPFVQSRDSTLVTHVHFFSATPSSTVADHGWTKMEDIVYYDSPFPAKIPINYHIGCMGLPPASHDFVDR